jgi:trigger factor
MTNKENPAGDEAKQNKSYDSVEVKKLEKSQVEVKASVPASVWEKFRGQAIKNINDSVTIDGFRKGQVPENILISKVGEAAILEEMAELAISKVYIDVVVDEKIDAIGRPHVQVTKLAKGNPLEFTAVTSIMPEFKLPDYKAIAKKEIGKTPGDDTKVTDKDVEDAILRLRKTHASHEGHDHEKMTPEEHEKMIMDSLPEFNDDFVRKLGGDFKDVEDFKKKVREMIGESKKDQAREKLRIRIADAIAEETKLDMPQVMIDSELNRTEAQFKEDLNKMGVNMEDYLKHSKKTIEDIRKEWQPHAEKKAKLQLVLNAIAEAEKIKPEKSEVDTEVNHILQHYKDADRERAEIYAETVLTNEKVFQFLENN